MKHNPNRRTFLKSALAAGAGAALPAFGSTARGTATDAPADALIFIHLSGGVAQTDTWDPKEFTPFRRGMMGRELLGTCPSIATRADGVRFGRGLERLAGLMNKGTLLRTLAGDPGCDAGHGAAQFRMMTGQRYSENPAAKTIGDEIAWKLGQRNSDVPAWHKAVASERVEDFERALVDAKRNVEMGARVVEVTRPHRSFSGFDAHEFGARRIAGMKRMIDRPIAGLIESLDGSGMLGRTVVCIVSEFGRSVELDADVIDEKAYGFHNHFSGATSALLFGGGFKKGYVHGKTAGVHPMVPVENAVTIDDFHATVFRAMGVAATRGRAVEALVGS